MKNTLDLSVAAYGDVINHQFDLAVLPWGATEPHNYHLPYATDVILSKELCVAAATKALLQDARAMVLPPITLGSQNPGQRELPFCIHARYETQYAILKDIVASLSYQGFNKLLIVNGHGGNSFKNMIRDMAVDYPHFMIACCNWYEVTDFKYLIDNRGEHADEVETSVMLHFHPELVDMSKAGDGASCKPALNSLAEGVIWMPRNWSEVSVDTGIGDPRMSTADKGKQIAEMVINKLADIIVDFTR